MVKLNRIVKSAEIETTDQKKVEKITKKWFKKSSNLVISLQEWLKLTRKKTKKTDKVERKICKAKQRVKRTKQECKLIEQDANVSKKQVKRVKQQIKRAKSIIAAIEQELK